MLDPAFSGEIGWHKGLRVVCAAGVCGFCYPADDAATHADEPAVGRRQAVTAARAALAESALNLNDSQALA